MTASTQKTLRLLYADDMSALREVVGAILANSGYSIESVADGALALERIIANPDAFEVLITDHHMPKLNGLELVARLRELSFPGKIVVVSSELNPTVHAAYESLNVDKILPKPFSPSELRQTLTEL